MAGDLLLIGALLALCALLPLVAWRRRGAAAARACLLGLLAGGLLAEGLLRTLEVAPPGRAEWLEPLRLGSSDEPAYWPDSELVYRYPTDPRGYFGVDRRVVGRINALGLRGPQCALEPTPGRTRVALLGDSFTLGIGVRDEDTLPAQLERALGPERFEVLNFGVSATDTVQQVQYLQGFVLRFAPQVVVLVFFLNDTERDSTMRYLSQPRHLLALRRHSWLLELLVGRLERARGRAALLRHYREGYEEQSPAWRAARDALTRARDLLVARDIDLVVAVHPVLVDLERGRYPFAGIHARVRDFCEQAGIPVVDLLEALADRRAPQLWVHPNDQHPNERCNRLSAEHLAGFLREGVLAR